MSKSLGDTSRVVKGKLNRRDILLAGINDEVFVHDRIAFQAKPFCQKRSLFAFLCLLALGKRTNLFQLNLGLN
jgi:hypothetical protein